MFLKRRKSRIKTISSQSNNDVELFEFEALPLERYTQQCVCYEIQGRKRGIWCAHTKRPSFLEPFSIIIIIEALSQISELQITHFPPQKPEARAGIAILTKVEKSDHKILLSTLYNFCMFPSLFWTCLVTKYFRKINNSYSSLVFEELINKFLNFLMIQII